VWGGLVLLICCFILFLILPQMTLEELVESERAALGTALTPVTLETFMAWKKRKLTEKRAALKVSGAKGCEVFSPAD
jgi:hypothetical protein